MAVLSKFCDHNFGLSSFFFCEGAKLFFEGFEFLVIFEGGPIDSANGSDIGRKAFEYGFEAVGYFADGSTGTHGGYGEFE